MSYSNIDIFGPQDKNTFDLPLALYNVRVKKIECDIPEAYVWTSDTDNINIYCFPKLHIPIWVNTKIDDLTNMEYISQIVFSETYWDNDFECYNFTRRGFIDTAFITSANSSTRCRIDFDTHSNTVCNIDYANYEHFNPGMGIGNFGESLEDLLFDENYFSEPYNIISEILIRNNIHNTTPTLETLPFNTLVPN